ncbi:hypothetical protein GQ53DRAFT_840588 [Thozetella sp. PMI_491]|nr:hypothetical protein GQ53DRAFT_840588 [Thozetella sp. PMI_491]
MQQKERSKQSEKGNGPNSPRPDAAFKEPEIHMVNSDHSQANGEQSRPQSIRDCRTDEPFQQQFPEFNDDCVMFSRELTPMLTTSLVTPADTLSPASIPLASGASSQQRQQGPYETDEDAGGLHGVASREHDRSSISSSAQSTREHHLPADTQAALIDSYFAHNQTIYPVIWEERFRASVANESEPPFLLFAIQYAGALHTPDSVIHRARFESREACLKMLYNKAKALFFEGEDDAASSVQLARVQAAFLLHNMWPTEPATMDSWTWLGLAIRLGQKMGMHRSASKSSLRDDDKKLWKKIWWSLFSCDTQIASDLQKPLMINATDCDVERLTINDFEPNFSLVSRLFVMEQVRLSEIRAGIVSRRFSPGNMFGEQETHRSALTSVLGAWKERIPRQLQMSETYDPDIVPLQALLLEVLYSHDLLLLHGPQTGNAATFGTTDTESRDISVRAADTIIQVTETIMNYKSLLHCSYSYTFALLGALSVQAVQGPSADQNSGLCMIALRTLSTMYGVGNVIRNMFQTLEKKRRMKAHGQGSTGNANASSSRWQSQSQTHNSGGTGQIPCPPLPPSTGASTAPWPTPSTTPISQTYLSNLDLQKPAGPQIDDSSGTSLLGRSVSVSTWEQRGSVSFSTNQDGLVDQPTADTPYLGGNEFEYSDCWTDFLTAQGLI